MARIIDNAQASLLTGLSVGTLANMRSKGTGPPSFKRNGRVVYRVAEVKQWIADREAATMRGGGA
ncbi:helix-turn-helix transcriptional regulator [Mycolicibacterium parafortuitum]|uniref:helix-turn-helix transcriptional regulator n=1 Tax=Mycolicibacterium parafortuitum TaxID=39692 RepID=UPI003F496CA4